MGYYYNEAWYNSLIRPGGTLLYLADSNYLSSSPPAAAAAAAAAASVVGCAASIDEHLVNIPDILPGAAPSLARI